MIKIFRAGISMIIIIFSFLAALLFTDDGVIFVGLTDWWGTIGIFSIAVLVWVLAWVWWKLLRLKWVGKID